MATEAPSFEKRSAVARPIPEAAPVMMATLSGRRIRRSYRSIKSGKDLAVEFDQKRFDQLWPHVVEKTRDIWLGAMLIEDLLVFPFFDEGNPTGVILALIEFIPNAPFLPMSRLDEGVQRLNKCIGLTFEGMKFRNANKL